MPRLPDAREQGGMPAPRVSGGITPVSAEGLREGERTGAMLSAIGDFVAQANDRQDKQDALAAANKAQESSIKLQFDPEAGYSSVRGEQVVGKQFTDKYNQQFNEQLQSIRGNLQNDNQRKYFDQHAGVLRMQYQGNLLRHQAQETERFNDQTDDAALKLQLRGVSADPTNELAFQTGMVQINGVIDSIAKRKGLGAEQVQELKGQYKDAAYAARITSVLEGVPGVAPANPRLAETMFKQVSDQMSPQVKNQLARQINAGVEDVQARDMARKFVYDPDQQTGQPPSANQLKVDLFKRIQAARDAADEMRPGDPKFADAVAARVQNYAQIVISNQIAQEANARDTLVGGMLGAKPDGSESPRTIDQLLANPSMRRAWNTATPETKQAIQSHFKNGGGSPARTPETQALLYQYMGKAALNREGFAQEDLSPLISRLPYGDFDKLANLQLAARNRQDRDAEKAANYQHALNLGLNFALKPLGIGVPTPNTSSSKREQYEQFSGRMVSWMEEFQAQNKRPPNDKEIISQAKSLTATLTVPGALWDSDKPAFQLKPEEEGRATVTLDTKNRDRISGTLRGRYGFEPTESMVQQAALYERLYPNNMERWRGFDQTMREYAKKQKPGEVKP